MAILSTGWTWSVEVDDSGLTVKHERRKGVEYPAAGTAYRLCDSSQLTGGTFDQCIGGDFDNHKGRIAIDLGSLPIDVQSWCVRIGGGEADCVAIRDLGHVVPAHDARRLQAARQYHEAAEQYRLAARRAGDLVRPDGTSLKEHYTGSARAADEQFIAAARRQAEEASTRQEREAALALLERAHEVAKAIQYSAPFGQSLSGLASRLKRKLKEDRRKADKEAAELVEKCRRVGQAEQIVRGETPQQLWLCENGWVAKVQDDSGVIAELKMPLDEADDANLVTDAFLQDLVGDSIPEVVVAVKEMCGSTGVALFGWGKDGQMELVWHAMNSVSCMDHGEPIADPPTVKDGVVLWRGEPMIWEAESESFAPSPVALARLREEQIQKAKELLRQGRPGPAFAALPDDPPSALAKKIAAGCERYYSQLLSKLRPQDDWGQPVGASGFRYMKVEVLEDGVKCAPNSATLKRKLSQLKREIQVEEQRIAARLAKIERQKQLAEQREAQRRTRELLGKVHGSGWTCGEFAFRLLSNGRARFITRDWDGSVDYASGTFEAETRGSQLELKFLKQGRLRASMYISQVSPRKIKFTNSPGARIGSWCDETSRI